MRNDDLNTQQKIIKEGKKEFLEKGFKDASLRSIVKRAGVTTGAFYGYYKDKEALFEALVSPVVNNMKDMFQAAHTNFEKLPTSIKQKLLYDYSIPYENNFIAYIYEYFDEFKLLITCAEGTAFSDFMDSLVNTEVESTVKYIQSTGNDALVCGRATPELLHIISSAYFSAIFEIVVHDMSKEAAESYMESLSQFFKAGWKTILSPNY